MSVIVLDAGHNSYGTDTGASGNGLLEQDLTLDIARRLKSLLEYNGFTVVMTRDGDIVPNGETLNGSLRSRVNIAENAGADLFVSIHINAGGGTGQEVLIYSAGGQAEKCANILLYYLVQAGQWYNRGLKTQNVYVIRKTSMPAVLTENGFIDSANDAEKLANPDFRQSLAVAHAKGICEYFGIAFNEPNQPQNQGGIYKVKNLVLVSHSVDERAAGYLADFLNCSIAFRDAISTSDLDQYENVYEVGGSQVYSRSKYLGGSDRYLTCQKVLDFISGK